MDTARLMKTAKKKFLSDRMSNCLLWMANEKPTPSIGDIKGEISMAPIITAVEFVSRPMDASTVEQTSIQRL